MTNMEGVGLSFVLIMIGVPLFLIILIAAYVTHRATESNLERDSDGNTQKKGEPISMTDLIREIVLHPDPLFRQITDGEANLFRPFLLITVGGIIFYLGFLYANDSLFLYSVLQGAIGNFLFLGLGLSPVFVIPCYVAWIVLTIGFFVVSLLFKGQGSFSTTFQNTGYGAAFYLILSGGVLLLLALVNVIQLAFFFQSHRRF